MSALWMFFDTKNNINQFSLRPYEQSVFYLQQTAEHAQICKAGVGGDGLKN